MTAPMRSGKGQSRRRPPRFRMIQEKWRLPGGWLGQEAKGGWEVVLTTAQEGKGEAGKGAVAMGAAHL
jgi:hypothetical protein